MSLIVTGASGHLGSLVVESLLERGVAPEQIVATGRRVDALAPFAARGVRTAELDYSRPETIDAVLSAGDTVLLVSGSEVGQRAAQHQNVIDAAVRAGAARIVYTSAPHATTSALVLAPEHKATEEAILASGLPYTILRNNWYSENYADTIAQATATGFFIGSVGDGLVASASRKDYADAAAVALTSPDLAGSIFELSGDTAWDYTELAAAISAVADREVEYRDLSPEAHADALRGFGLDEGTVGFVVALDGNIRDGLLSETSGDLSRLIGRPTTPLVDGLRAL
ncbi:MAG: SDR family oxidoreductase [Lacisediminihabitans sp.]